jgi:uncharacterized membrane protein
MYNPLLIVSAIVFVVLDSIYLNLIKGHFSALIKNIQGSPLVLNMRSYVSIAVCYIFLITGLNYFIIKPNRSIQDAFLLGLVIYGVYETTNYALFKKWTLFTVIVDTLWGGILFALTTYIVRLLRF